MTSSPEEMFVRWVDMKGGREEGAKEQERMARIVKQKAARELSEKGN